jgi:hypothetical protein
MNTKINYLGNRSWQEISREERMFCAELYFNIRQNPAPFLRLLGIEPSQPFDVGYEVCLYRDVSAMRGIPLGQTEFPPKRTFDLTVFTRDTIYIIEAKSHEGFTEIQLGDIDKDKTWIPELFGNDAPRVATCAVISSKYTPKATTRAHFDTIITWKEEAAEYGQLFGRADEIYRN